VQGDSVKDKLLAAINQIPMKTTNKAGELVSWLAGELVSW
jgi:hypothetical protein